MKKAFLLSLYLFALVFAFGEHLNAQMSPVAFVEGTLMNVQGQPLPGVTVFLVHPSLGRSVPVTTNLTGYFSFTNVPLSPSPYYFEAYWGNQLVYRNILSVTSQLVQVPGIIVR